MDIDNGRPVKTTVLFTLDDHTFEVALICLDAARKILASVAQRLDFLDAGLALRQFIVCSRYIIFRCGLVPSSLLKVAFLCICGFVGVREETES